MKNFLLLIFLLYIKNSSCDDANEETVLCGSEFCATATDTNPCPTLSDNCKAQNATNNGMFLPSPDPCNCCQYCIDNLNEGDFCDKGEPGSVPEGMCGPGLTCSDDGICVKMAEAPISKCSKAQADYDSRRKNGKVGSMEVRPKCDDSGFYEPFRCIPGSTCFCVNRDGDRIFGEISDTTEAQFLTCQCSRKYDDARKFIGRELHPDEHFRCKDNGDYDAIQCIGDQCLCVDASDGAITYPKRAMVNMTDISNKTLPCFNPEVDQEGIYFHKCATEYLEVLEVLKGYKEDGFDTVFEMIFPRCTIDGKYGPVQNNSESAYCATPDGELIEPYKVPVSQLPGMDCKCARTLLLLPDDKLEKPECCPNGNFKKVQCRRGTCYCVDSDGYQSSEQEVDEIDKDQLECFKEMCTFS